MFDNHDTLPAEILAELKNSYSGLLESIPDVIVSLEYPSGSVLYINPAVKELLGFDPEEFYGSLLLLKRIDPDDRKSVIELWRNIERETGPALFLYRIRKNDGDSIWVEQKNRIIRDSHGNAIAINAVIRDISLRKKLEEESLKNLYFSENLFQHAPYIAFQIGSDGRILRFNHAFERVWRLTKEDIEDYSIWKDRQMLKAGIVDLLREVFAGRVVEFPVLPYTIRYRDHRETVYVTGKGFPYPAKDNEAKSIILMGEDVTERRLREEEYLEIRKLESIGRLAGGIAHDFNNMLAGISGYAEIMMRKMGRDDQNYRFAESIHTASMKAATLTSQLLGFARRGKYNPEFVDIGKALLFALGATPGLSQRVKIVKTIESMDYAVFADVNQLRQLFVEILKNAVEAMGGSGIIHLQAGMAEQERIVDGMARITTMSSIRISVTDNGPGIPEDIESKIFEPYFTTKDKNKHAGMGLSLAWGTVKNHGGRIEIRSEQGETTVTVLLPAVKKPADSQKEDQSAPKTVLIIDDSEEIRSVLRTFYEEKGCNVETASGGKAGLLLLKNMSSPCDLVFLDYLLPDISGREMLYEITRRHLASRVVLLSGSSIEGLPEDLLNSPDIHVMPKPFSLEDVESIMKKN